MKISDGDFVALFEDLGAYKMSRETGLGIRGLYKRRTALEKKLGRQITGPEHHSSTRNKIKHPQRVYEEVYDGIVLVGSDAHYWPSYITTAHKAFVHFAKKLQPKVIVNNGDALDGSTISRHSPIGWESRPSLIQEIETTKERLGEIMAAAPNAKRVWNLGNHDGRFETRLATVAPEYARVNGFHLKDHFPEWWPAWSCWINEDVVIKHRFKGGIHATHNNTMWAGKSIVTGHLHSLKVTPFSDYNGIRFGVDTGTLADPDGPQFVDYTEDNPRNQRSGFAVLTFRNGRLMWPELVHVIEDGKVEFRAEIISV